MKWANAFRVGEPSGRACALEAALPEFTFIGCASCACRGSATSARRAAARRRPAAQRAPHQPPQTRGMRYPADAAPAWAQPAPHATRRTASKLSWCTMAGHPRATTPPFGCARPKVPLYSTSTPVDFTTLIVYSTLALHPYKHPIIHCREQPPFLPMLHPCLPLRVAAHYRTSCKI